MARLPGDPGPLRWLAFALGFRLPDDNLDWVRHELTDAGWRLRTIVRHLAVIVPVCVIVAVILLTLVPAPVWLAGVADRQAAPGPPTVTPSPAPCKARS